MSESGNPYLAPQAGTVLSIDGQSDASSYYVDGKNLMVRDGVELPNLCIKTGEPIPGGKRKKKTLYWAHPAWALLIFTGVLIYAIVYLCVRKKVTLHYSVSSKVLKKRFVMSCICLLSVFGGIALGIYFIVASNSGESRSMFIAAAFITSFFGLILTAVMSNFLRVKKHNEGWFMIVGPGKGFLQALEPARLPN